MKNTLILLTTSHKPSPRTRSFTKDLANILLYSIRINRGKKTLNELALEAYRNKAKYIFIVGERHGNPSMIKIYNVYHPPALQILKEWALFRISGVKLTRENPSSSRAYNPEYIDIDYGNCTSDYCYEIADIFIKIYREYLSNKPDIRLILYNKGRHVYLKPYNRLNKICGPIIRFSGVKRYE